MKTATRIAITSIELTWLGDAVTGQAAQSWQCASVLAATERLKKVSNDLSFHGADRDVAGLVATYLTYKVTWADGFTLDGFISVRYDQPQLYDFRDELRSAPAHHEK